MLHFNARTQALATIQDVWPGAAVLEDGTLRGQLRRAWLSGYKVRLGPNGHDLRLTPGALRWPTRWFSLVVEHQDEVRTLLAARRAADSESPHAGRSGAAESPVSDEAA